mgnify:CR=1 FL=1
MLPSFGHFHKHLLFLFLSFASRLFVFIEINHRVRDRAGIFLHGVILVICDLIDNILHDLGGLALHPFVHVLKCLKATLELELDHLLSDRFLDFLAPILSGLNRVGHIGNDDCDHNLAPNDQVLK